MLLTPESSQKEGSMDTVMASPPNIDNDAPDPPNNARPATTDSRCLHWQQLVASKQDRDTILRRVKAALLWGITRANKQPGPPPAKRRKIDTPTCSQCNDILIRPFLCLHCSYAACWKGQHVISHLHQSQHNFCIDVKSGSLFCSGCNDFIYSEAVEKLRVSLGAAVVDKQSRTKDPKKIIREPYNQWSPSLSDKSVLNGATSVACQSRRGLLNLGQTCAMNTVLQAFVHNPLLRNYFLSDRHNAKLCKNKDKECMCCEMDKFFTEIFSDESSPYGPISFLPILWKAAGGSSALSEGYAQHDAHEIFLACLSQIHSDSKGSTNVSCNCVIHSTFSGRLSSEVKCGKASCGHLSTKVDPMFDISLELRGKGGKDDGSENTLTACLRKYTQPENLPNKEYTCSKCGSNSGATKSMSINKLPPVLAFQLKRFGHKLSDKSTAQKINTPIKFPASIDMFPYTKSGATAGKASVTDMAYTYDLFCVINHEGAMDNGHYTNFARYANEWYLFNDDKVAHATLSQVLASTAYLLFYVKRSLDYKPLVKPTYVITRETEALKEKEREREKEMKLSQEIDEELMSIL